MTSAFCRLLIDPKHPKGTFKPSIADGKFLLLDLCGPLYYKLLILFVPEMP
jgi:hypothetical protein